MLGSVPNLNRASLTELVAAAALVDTARLTNAPVAAGAGDQHRAQAGVDASTQIDTNLTFQIGDGTVMF